MTAQLALDLGHRPALGRDAFLVAPANAEAVGWIDRWPDWPAPALVLEGPAGAGKSHLAEVWRGRSGAALLDGATLDRQAVPLLLAGPACLVVENAVAADETALLHLYNATAERRGHLLLTASTAPSRWSIRLADLSSRLRALPIASIRPPDEPLIRALLVKLFHDRQLVVSAETIAFAALRIDRSFDTARRLVAALDAAALAGHRAITVPLVREVLRDQSFD